MNIQQILTDGGGLLLILMTLVQIAPIKVNPWSAIAKTIGRGVNADIFKRLDVIEHKLDEHVVTDERKDVDDLRSDILRFNNEILRSIDHTHEEFVEVLTKIDGYERYCSDHKDYPNNRAVCAIENIKDVYKHCLRTGKFAQDIKAAAE